MLPVDSTSRRPLFAVGIATLAVSTVFIGMIWNFLIALFLAAVFSAMAIPLYRKILGAVGDRPGLATAVTMVVLYTGVLVPIVLLVYLVAVQADELASKITPLLQQIDDQGLQLDLPEWVPFREELEEYGPQLASKLGELAGKLAGFFVSAASALTKGTASFFMSLFVMTYAMVFFLREKTDVLTQLLRYSGLPLDIQDRLVERILSISRATIKGTLVIGAVQGLLGGIGFAVSGIPGAAFWGAVMAIASIIPGIGPALIWVPGVIYLFSTGETTTAILLAAWSGLVVSTIDNVLRPYLVGRDTAMPDIVILISTLGGLAMFGAEGLIIGPVIAGLFITLWQMFNETFSRSEPAEAKPGPAEPSPAPDPD